MSAHRVLADVRNAQLFNSTIDPYEADLASAVSVTNSWWDMETDGGCTPMNVSGGTSAETAASNAVKIQSFLDTWDGQEGKASWLFPAKGYAIDRELITPNSCGGLIQCIGGEGWVASEDSYNGGGDGRGGPASRLIWNGAVGAGSGPMIRHRGQGLQVKGCLSLQGHWDATSRANLQNNNFTDSTYDDFCEVGWMFEGRVAGTPPIGFNSSIGMGKVTFDNLKLSCFRKGVQFGEYETQNHADNSQFHRITGEYLQTLVEINNEQAVNLVFGYVRAYVCQNAFLWRDGGSVHVTYAEIFNGGSAPVGPARLLYLPGTVLAPNPRNYNLRGDWDPADGLPGGGTAQTYDAWRCSTTGESLGGVTWYEDDWLIAKVDNASTTEGAFSSNWVRLNSIANIASTSASFTIGTVKFDAQSPRGANGADLRLIEMDRAQAVTVHVGGCFSTNGTTLNPNIAKIMGGTTLNVRDVHVQPSGNATLNFEMHSDVTYGKPVVQLTHMKLANGIDPADMFNGDSTGNGMIRWTGCTQHDGTLQTDGWIEMISGVVQPVKDLGSLFGTGAHPPVLSGLGTVGANITAATTSEVDLVTATPANKTIAANYLSLYGVARFKAYGYYTTPASAPELTLRFKVGGTTLRTIVIGATDLPGSATNLLWRVTSEVHMRTVGASGTAMCVLVAEFFDSASNSWFTAYNTAGSTVSVDTTAANEIALTAQWTDTTGSPGITCHGHYLDKVSAGN